MNLVALSSLTLSLCSLTSLSPLATAQTSAPLPSDHYLVGTQGWVNSKITNGLNTIQVISPYTGKARILSITGLPPGEAAASFVLQGPVSFLVGTKSLNTATASGNVYQVRLQRSNTWKASLVNKTPLGINVSDMVVLGQNAYVIGSAVFGPGGNGAKIMRISLTKKTVSLHLALGDNYKVIKPRGARGIGSTLVLVGATLHAFTFDTTEKTRMSNEHWTISTTLPVVVAQQLPSLPVSKRRMGVKYAHGFGTSGAFIDPTNSQRLIVVGRWGELVWRGLMGKNLRYEAFPGTIQNVYAHLSELWRGVALNTNTHAFGLGDHDWASIDERRIPNSPKATEPFSNNIAKAILPPLKLQPKDKVLFTIAGMVYIPGKGSYRMIGNGCPDGVNGIPTSYASSTPARGNQNFGMNLHARPKGTKTPTAAILLVSGKQGLLGLAPLGAPGCSLHIGLGALGIIAPVGSLSNQVSISGLRLPNHKITVYTQWALFAPKTNKLGLVFSDARALKL